MFSSRAFLSSQRSLVYCFLVLRVTGSVLNSYFYWELLFPSLSVVSILLSCYSTSSRFKSLRIGLNLEGSPINQFLGFIHIRPYWYPSTLQLFNCDKPLVWAAVLRFFMLSPCLLPHAWRYHACLLSWEWFVPMHLYLGFMEIAWHNFIYNVALAGVSQWLSAGLQIKGLPVQFSV